MNTWNKADSPCKTGETLDFILMKLRGRKPHHQHLLNFSNVWRSPGCGYRQRFLYDKGWFRWRLGLEIRLPVHRWSPKVPNVYEFGPEEGSLCRWRWWGLDQGRYPHPSHPIERGIISHWDNIEKNWDHTYNKLHVDSAEHPVLMTEHQYMPKSDREKKIRLLFETFCVVSFFVAQSTALSLYPCRNSQFPMLMNVNCQPSHDTERRDWTGTCSRWCKSE